MNGYDFDKTIHKGDSFTAFFFFTILKRPFLILALPFQAVLVLLHLVKLISKKEIKELAMMNLKFFKNKEKLVEEFWDKNIKNIKKWYLEQKQEDDIIISASPFFLINAACKRLGLKNVIATDMDISTGKINGKNCWGQQKVVEFEKQFGTDLILKTFYSDSLSDIPMMKKAEKGIFVKGDERKVIYTRETKNKN